MVQVNGTFEVRDADGQARAFRDPDTTAPAGHALATQDAVARASLVAAVDRLSSILARLEATLVVSGTVAVSNHPSPLTDTQLRASPVPVDPGVVQAHVANHPATFPLPPAQVAALTPQTNTLTDTQLRASPVPVATGLSPLTDTQLRAAPVPVDTGLAQPQVDGLTDAELRASPVPTTVTNHPVEFPLPAAQVTMLIPQQDGLTDTQLRAAPVPVVTGLSPLTDTQLRAAPVPVDLPHARPMLHAVVTLTTGGTHTVVTPPAGQALRVWWVAAMPDPGEDQNPLVTVSLDGDRYRSWVIQRAQRIDGAVNAPLTVTLSQAGTVAVTILYELI